MKKYFFVFLPLILPFSTFAVDLSKYANKTFFSVLLDIETGELFFAPTEGARYINGESLPQSEIVDRYGGHGDIARKHNLNLDVREVYAGGVLVDHDSGHGIKIKSFSVNGQRTDDYLVPKNMRRYFIDSIVHLIEDDVVFEEKVFHYSKNVERLKVCETLFLPMP